MPDSDDIYDATIGGMPVILVIVVTCLIIGGIFIATVGINIKEH